MYKYGKVNCNALLISCHFGSQVICRVWCVKSMVRNCIIFLVKVMFSARDSTVSYFVMSLINACLFVRLFVAVSGCRSGIKCRSLL